jgi:hypothetical protein
MKHYEEIGKVRIVHDEWSYGWADLGRKCYAKCYYEKRVLAFNKLERDTLSEGKRCSYVNVVAHEVIHAAIPILSERQVNNLGNIIEEVFNSISTLGPTR